MGEHVTGPYEGQPKPPLEVVVVTSKIKDSDIKISFIVAVFNIEVFVSECIESLIHQTYRNIEIILIDDGSTDNSGKICD